MAELVTAGEAEERRKIREALKSSGYVILHAATALGLSEATMRRRVAALGLSDELVANSRRIRRRRENQEFPRAPHEVSRQAEDQAEHRAAGLCSCGQPPVPRSNGSPGRMCERCRGRARRQKGGLPRRATDKFGQP
jgi:hypothetical protein